MYEKLSPLFREAMIGLTDSIVNGEIVPKKLAAQAAVASWPQQAYAVQGQIQSQVPIDSKDWAAGMVKQAILQKLASADPRDFKQKTAEALSELREAIEAIESGIPREQKTAARDSGVKVVAKGF